MLLRRAFASAIAVACGGLAVPPRVNAQVPWAALISNLSNAANLVGNLAKNVQEAVDRGLQIWDKFKLRQVKNFLSTSLAEMADLNSTKEAAQEALGNYLEHKYPVPTWAALQDRWNRIVTKLDGLTASLDGAQQQLVQGAGLEGASHIGSALNLQKETYGALSRTPENGIERPQLVAVHKALGDVIAKLEQLETVIDRYVRSPS